MLHKSCLKRMLLLKIPTERQTKIAHSIRFLIYGAKFQMTISRENHHSLENVPFNYMKWDICLIYYYYFIITYIIFNFFTVLIFHFIYYFIFSIIFYFIFIFSISLLYKLYAVKRCDVIGNRFAWELGEN